MHGNNVSTNCASAWRPHPPDIDRVSTDSLHIEALGESMLLVRFGASIDASCNARVHAAVRVIRAAALNGVHDVVPAYASLAVAYDAQAWLDPDGRSPAPWKRLGNALCSLLENPHADSLDNPQLIEIPVCYDDEFGQDLKQVAAHCRLSIAAVIERHTAATYRVAMLGFAPGFPYLLGLDPSLHMPRRSSPRLRVARGSVAIGGAQTGIYPRELPGGWSLIGRTPLNLFDATRDQPALLSSGDQVRFVSIGHAEFLAQASARKET